MLLVLHILDSISAFKLHIHVDVRTFLQTHMRPQRPTLVYIDPQFFFAIIDFGFRNSNVHFLEISRISTNPLSISEFVALSIKARFSIFLA